MKFLSIFIFVCALTLVTAPPVTEKKPKEKEAEDDSDIKENLADYMEYHRYLKEVIAALESDPEFRDKLEKADYVDIRTGKIAHELDFVNHNVRTKLDEIKRTELERLRHLAMKQNELKNNIDMNHIKVSTQADHLDHSNVHTFEINDLKKLILKTTKDLEEADKKRKEEFKEYEMQKEFEKQQKLHNMDEEHRKQLEKEYQEREDKHKKHEPLHHPGSRQQLEEVWEKQDHMESQEFNPKVFFMLHDVDGNGVWDQNEVKALFLKELDKMYENGAPEDDMRERQEEMERMREHVFYESDTNRDGLISYEEFLIQTRRKEFEKDPGWKTLDEQEIYSQNEYEEFERQRLEEVQRLIRQGVLPPQPIYPGMQPLQHNQVQHPDYQQQQQYHPNAIPQGQAQYHQQQQQQHPNAVPQPQYHPNGVPQMQQQYHPNQAPQGYQQQYSPQVQQQPQPQQYHPQVQQPHPNAVPQQVQQPHPNVVPQQVPPPQYNQNAQPQNVNPPKETQQAEPPQQPKAESSHDNIASIKQAQSQNKAHDDTGIKSENAL